MSDMVTGQCIIQSTGRNSGWVQIIQGGFNKGAIHKLVNNS